MAATKLRESRCAREPRPAIAGSDRLRASRFGESAVAFGEGGNDPAYAVAGGRSVIAAANAAPPIRARFFVKLISSLMR